MTGSSYGWKSWWRTVSFQPLLITTLFGCVTIYSVVSGLQWKHRVFEEQSNPQSEIAETQSAWFKSLQDAVAGLTVSPALAHPMNLPVLIQRPPGVLGQFGYSREDLYPSAGTINGFNNEALIFRRYELDAPNTLMHGRMDLTFVIVILLPLVLCLLNYDHIARDRERGSMRTMLVHGASPGALLWSRTFLSSLPPLVVLLLASIIGALVASGVDLQTCVRLLWWSLCLALYWIFWVSLCAFVAACCRNSLSAALLSVTLWIGLTIVLPSILQFAISNVVEAPSKVHLLAVARAAEAEALESLDQRAEAFMAQHASEIPQSIESFSSYYRRAYLSNDNINKRVGVLFDQYEDELNADLRILDAFQFLSPSTAAFRMFQAISGSGFQRATEFQNQARRFFREYFDAIGIATLQQQRLTVAEARSIARFSFKETLETSTIVSSALCFAVVILFFPFATNLIASRIETAPD